MFGNMTKEKMYSAISWGMIGILLFMVASAAVAVVVDLKVDYPYHIGMASKITWSKLFHPIAFLKENCYPAWHILTWLTMTVFGCNGRAAAAFVTGGCVVSVWLWAALYFAKHHSDANKDFLRSASILLMLVTPIYLCWFNPRLIVGQWSPNVLHNPTNLMARAIGFPCFLLYAAAIAPIGHVANFRLPLLKLMGLTFAFLMATLSKPSFIQVFLPAMACLFIYKAIRYKTSAIKPLALLGATFIPALLLCGVQLWESFYSEQTVATGIGIDVLKAWSFHSPCPPVSWLLSALFPLVMAAWAVRTRRFTISDALAWLMFGFGLFEGAVLVENGPRLLHCNFVWGYALALFFIWFVSMDKFITLTKTRTTGGKSWFNITVSILSLHVLSGLWYLWRLIVLRIWR